MEYFYGHSGAFCWKYLYMLLGVFQCKELSLTKVYTSLIKSLIPYENLAVIFRIIKVRNRKFLQE